MPSTPGVRAIVLRKSSSLSSSKPSVRRYVESRKISHAVFRISKPTATAAAESIQGKPNCAPTIPTAAPILTMASEKLSLAAASSALLLICLASRLLYIYTPIMAAAHTTATPADHSCGTSLAPSNKERTASTITWMPTMAMMKEASSAATVSARKCP
ncbi:hypothetical protein D3C75_800020 [compost metagenome]